MHLVAHEQHRRSSRQSDYKVQLQDANGNVIWTFDPYPASSTGSRTQLNDISYVATVSDRHYNVPVPQQGYWSKLQAGHAGCHPGTRLGDALESGPNPCSATGATLATLSDKSASNVMNRLGSPALWP